MDGVRSLILLLFSINAGTFFCAKATFLPRSHAGHAVVPARAAANLSATNDSFIPISATDLDRSINFGRSVVDHLQRLETNLAWSDVAMKKDTPSHGLLLDSIPEREALLQGKDALVVAKASMYLLNSHCKTHKLNANDCAKQLAAQKVSDAPIRRTCELIAKRCNASETASPYRSADGCCNRRADGNVGRSFTRYTRLLPPSYLDGIQEFRRSVTKKTLPSPRSISNRLIKSDSRDDDNETTTLALVQWTEFVGNDLMHTATSKMIHLDKPIECCAKDGSKLRPRYVHPFCEPIRVPTDDRFYAKYGLECMYYVRSLPSFTHDCSFGPYEQINQATHFLDASQIYGSSSDRMSSLRTMRGGLLRTTMKNGNDYLPLAKDPTETCQHSSSWCFASGDTRTNSHPHLTAMVTVWHREHNRVARELNRLNPKWGDEKLFQEARRIVVAEVQRITYDEWLPVLLGPNYANLFANRTYDADVDAGVSNAFATAAIRFIKSMMDEMLELYDANRTVSGTLQLRNHFNNPDVLMETDRLDALIRGLATQRSRALDLRFVKDMVQHLYGNSDYGLDVLSLDIQRGRDHGLPGYTAYRKLCGLSDVKRFEDLSGEMTVDTVTSLRAIYDSPHDIDLIVGGIAERRDGESVLGPTFSCLIADQLLRTRGGDRYFYDNDGQPAPFTQSQLMEIRKVTLARIFCDNADGIKRMQPRVFEVPSTKNRLANCDDVKAIGKPNLKRWAL